MNELARKKCRPCEGGTKPFTPQEAKELLKGLKGWAIENGKLAKTYPFKNYYETMAFVNALAWISHREDHHPDLDRKSTRLNSSHLGISYAVFCFKKTKR